MNTELCKHFLGLQFNNSELECTDYIDVILALDKCFGNNWAWEVIDEKFFLDNTQVCTTVAVYIPGKICTGRITGHVKNYSENHLRAIFNACENLIGLKSQSLTSKVQNESLESINNQQMTPEQIMQAIGGFNPAEAPTNNVPSNTTQINTAAEFYNAGEEVPFNNLTDNCCKELAQELQPKPVQEQLSEYDRPQPNLNGYSQHQIERVNKFKAENKVTNDEEFSKWVKTWNKDLRGKCDLNPGNINDFLNWVEDFEKNFFG